MCVHNSERVIEGSSRRVTVAGWGFGHRLNAECQIQSLHWLNNCQKNIKSKSPVMVLPFNHLLTIYPLIIHFFKFFFYFSSISVCWLVSLEIMGVFFFSSFCYGRQEKGELWAFLNLLYSEVGVTCLYFSLDISDLWLIANVRGFIIGTYPMIIKSGIIPISALTYPISC